MNNEQITCKFILNSKELIIPLTFQFFHSINHEIREILTSNKYYNIKSDINEDIFRSFIQNCVKNELFDINEEYIFQYEQLCREFDYKMDLIQLYKNSLTFSFSVQNKKLKQRIQEVSNRNKKNINNYQKTIHLLFDNNIICSKFKSEEVKNQLYSSCKKENIKIIESLNSKVIEENGLFYILNENKMEAGIFCNSTSNFDVFVPKSIKFQSKEFNVTRIFENAFESNKLMSIHFPEDSKLQVIEKDAFFHSYLTEIIIPSSVNKIEEAAFSYCYRLKNCEFSKNSQLTLIDRSTFLSSSIESIIIPSKVTKISEFAFCECIGLQKVEFEENSELKIIEKNAFEETCFEKISIPASIEKLDKCCFFGVSFLFDVDISSYNKHYHIFDNKFIIEKSDSKSDIFDVIIFARRDLKEAVIPSFIKKISQYAFSGCLFLEKIAFDDHPQLEIISKNAFLASSIENITIPSSVVNIEEGCFNEAFHLKEITISKNNQNYSYFDDKFIIGKKYSKSDIFDVLIFARKNIKTAVIPSFIKYIAPFAFKECRFLDKVDFEENSNLESIGNHAFYESSIKTIKIPSKITKFEDHVFCCCDKLEKVEFENKSKLMLIDRFALSASVLKSFWIPKNCIQISEHTFCDCLKLKRVEFENNSKLKIIGNSAFFNSSLEYFKVSSDVIHIGKFAFAYLKKLQIVEFDEDIELKFIDKDLFKGSTNAIIMIPARVIHLLQNSFEFK